MIALLSWRVWAGVAIAIALAASHFKAYHAGGVSARAELQLYQLEATQAAAKASEEARKKEANYRSTNERISRDLAKEKAARAADAAIVAGKLRDLESTLDSARASDPGPGSDADDPPLAIARECARSLVILDEYASGLASQTRALQAYTRDVCLAK